MGKAILAAALVLIASGAHAQGLKKGNLVGTHIMTVKLEPGVTMDQFVAAYNAKVIPDVEKGRPGWKAYPVRRIRGEKADGMALIIVIPSEAERDKYYNADGSDSELGKATKTRFAPAMNEMEKLGAITADTYTDWVVY